MRSVTACLKSWYQGVEPIRLLWQAKAASRTGSGDEMIISAGDFLVQALKPAARRMAWERGTLCLVAFAALGEPAISSGHLSCIVALLICEHSLLNNEVCMRITVTGARAEYEILVMQVYVHGVAGRSPNGMLKLSQQE